MSLINDALKRTKQAQQQSPPTADGPQLKSVDPATAKSASNAKSLLYIMVACVVVGNALLFFAIKDRGAKKPELAPASQPVTKVESPQAAPPTPAPAPQSTAAVTLPTTPAKVEPAPVSVATTTPVAAPSAAVAETNSPAASVQPEPPKPAPLKLQSIVYNPGRSSAMVSGKFVFVGDKVQGFRITAIDQETVTLVGNGQTNVLSLP